METVDVSAPPASKKNSTFRVPPWLTGILVIAVLTFGLGFYLPAVSANETRAAQLKELSSEYDQAVAGYESARKELAALQAVSEKQQGQLKKISDAESSARGALSELYVEVKKALQTEIKAKLISVDQGADSVRISLEAMYLIYPHKTFVHAQGEQLLCKISKAIPKNGSRPTEIVAHANGAKPGSRLVEKQFPTSWPLSGVLAAEVAEKLQACGIAGTELRAVGAAHYEGEAKKARKSAARFEIVVYPASESE